MKRRINLKYRGQSHKIAWYAGTSDGAIRETIKESLGFAPESSNLFILNYINIARY